MAEQDQQQLPPIHPQPQHLSAASSTNVIPETLIALAKDSRYVKEIQALFLKVLSIVLPRRRHQLLEQEAWILASLLSLGLGIRHTSKRTTLGMDAVGLQFTKNSARWKLILFSFGALSWAYAFSPHRNVNSSINRNNPPSLQGRPSENVDQVLRGSSRREFHERQRQAMLRRANHAEASTSQGSINDTRTNGSSAQSGTGSVSSSTDTIRQRIKSILLTLARVLASAVLAPFEGPHTLPAETHQQQQRNAVPGTASVQEAGRWLAKLQLVHFCITGVYPTWLNRFTGHGVVSESFSSRLHHHPTTARLVGLLLGAQVVATLIQASSSAVSHWLVNRQQQRQWRESSQPESSPAIVFKPATNAPSSVGSSVCSICKMERTHPSAPSCGHVFCWKCLVHWVSVIRPECPLCRSPCRPQDIVALYNYAPSNSS